MDPHWFDPTTWMGIWTNGPKIIGLTWEEQPVGPAQGHSHTATQHMWNSSKSSVDKNDHPE